jgi:hypothetical protein
MTTPRRRIVRQAPTATPTTPDTQRQAQRLRTQMGKQQAALARWMARLKRAFNAVIKAQGAVTRLNRRLAQLEE